MTGTAPAGTRPYQPGHQSSHPARNRAAAAVHREHPDLITCRLRELDEEWDIERAIEANASALAFTGVAAGIVTDDRRWFILPALVSGFLFQHAVQGWCPPIPILRWLGFRTSYGNRRRTSGPQGLARRF
jgi:hypothetical protein